MGISLEDFCEDIVGKAMRGRNRSAADLASEAGVPESAIQSLLRGEGDETTARAVGPPLDLHPDKLADALAKRWHPQPRQLEGLFMTNTPYHDMFVNAYLIFDPGSKEGAFFDTGADASDLVDQAKNGDVTIRDLFLTHTHPDHILDLDRLVKAFPEARVHVGRREPIDGAEPVDPGDRFSIGNLQVTARLTWGHSKGGITYVIEGLASPVAVVGDALFAGSMGGGKVSYEDALRCNREEILTLPNATVLCPGHGPLTTVAEEKEHNPFF